MTPKRDQSGFIGSWLDETYQAERDAQPFLDRMLDDVPLTPQRRRRLWWLPFLTRTQRPTSSDDTIDYQPTPIPAMNGHAPTVIGRTQSMLSPVKTITAGALVFALGGVLLIAQPFDQQGGSAPGAVTDGADASPGSFTGSWTETDCIDEPDSTYEAIDGIEYASGSRCFGPVSSTDARFSGTLSQYLSYQGPVDEVGDFDLYGFTSVSDNVFRLVNDEGAWQGHSPAFELQPCEFSAAVVALTGEGAYESLTAVVEFPPTTACSFDSGLRGVIFGGPLPPAWDIKSGD